jgi:hypothetical protein
LFRPLLGFRRVKISVVANSCKKIEQAEQQKKGPQHDSHRGSGKKNELDDGKNNEHNTHANVHSGGIQPSFSGILLASVFNAVINGVTG